MPYEYKWVDPELAVEHQGVQVFHCYKDDEINQGRRTYSFTTDSSGDEAEDPAFDVRDLPNWRPQEQPFNDDTEHVLKTLRAAIELGYIKPHVS